MKYIIILLVFVTSTIQAAEVPDSFKSLSVYNIRDSDARIYYNGKLAVIEKNNNYILRFIGKEDNSRIYYLDFDEGPSADPRFFVKERENDEQGKYKIIKSINGTNIFIPGNGYIYVSGHTNNMFNMRRKFLLKNDNCAEVKQPFYYVGLKTITLEPMQLYRSKEQKEIIAKLFRNSPIEVLINSGEYYLLKSSFGLVGWIKIPETLIQTSPIKGLYFAGD